MALPNTPKKNTVMSNNNGWDVNKKLVRHQIKTMDESLAEINQRLTNIESKIWILQIKAAGIGGFVAWVTSYIMGRL